MQIAGGTVAPNAQAKAQADLRAALIVPPVDRAAVKGGAARVLASSTMSGAAWAKSQARAKVQQIVERLKLLRKLYAYDPKKMAQALAQVFKELKAAVKAYGKAGGDELDMAGGAASGVVAAPSQTSSSGTSPGQDQAAPAADTADAADAAPTAPAAAPDHALYDAVVGEARKSIGEDGLDFIKTVRGLTNQISDLLETARTQAHAKKPDKAMTAAFDDADKALGDLRQEMAGVEQDIHVAVPAAGMRISVAA